MFGKEQSDYGVVTDRLADQIKLKHNDARDKELRIFWDKRRLKQQAIQDHCGHIVTFKDEFEDRHKGETWITEYCKSCGKELAHY